MTTLLQRYKSYISVIVVSFFCTLAVAGMTSISDGLFQDWENKTLDYRFKLRGAHSVDPRIVLIDIDDRSIQTIGRWPWDRKIHAEMVELLSESGVATIGYDILFNEHGNEAGDKALIEAIEKAGNVTLPTGFELETDRDRFSLLIVKREVGPFSRLREVAAGIGHISSNRDADGTIRRVPLLVNYNDTSFPSFSLSILSGYFKAPLNEDAITLGKAVDLRSDDVQSQRPASVIPINDEGMMMINYAGPWVETFVHYPFADILEIWMENREDLKNALQGKIIVISNTATGYDLKPIPFEADHPGGGVHANILNTILTGRYIQETGTPMSFLIAFALSVVTAFITLRGKWWFGSLTTFGVVFIYFFVTQALFSNGRVFPLLAPFLSVSFTHLSMLLYQSRQGQHQVAKLVEEKDVLSGSLKGVTAALQQGKVLLQEKRDEHAGLIHNLKELEGRETEKVEKIKGLESDLFQAQANLDHLMDEKRRLIKEIAARSIAKTKKGPSLGERWDHLQTEASRHRIVTRSRDMLEVFERAKKVAKSSQPVLLLGETGTGKELFASAIHAMSPRSNKPFITLSMPTLQDTLFESELFGHVKGAFTGAVSDKKGKFQLADGGTLFLDEIGEMPLQLQAKLLRVLQTGSVDRIGAAQPDQVDVRIIAATNRDLYAEVQAKTFREDLYYRLDGVTVSLLPLRKRHEDFETLTDYLLQKSALTLNTKVKGISKGARERIKTYSWPGNIRELEKTLAKGMLLSEGDLITESDLELRHDRSKKLEEEANTEIKSLSIEDTGESLSDQVFLSLLKGNRFEIGRTAEQLNIKRDAVASRFKGICLKVLEEQGRDFNITAEKIAAGTSEKRLVDRKIREYYRNLLKFVQQFENRDEALAECSQRFKNVKKKYHPSMERLIRQYFETVVSARP